MGKKGTKRKTKWRTLPLGEEAGGSGNEEELHDEDQSTTSSVVGQSAIAYKPQTPYYKMPEKPFRPNRRFSYERYKAREPLVKLESKTFDEEEYTKITTPRQDVLFKKGYFGRKKESSIEETAQTVGEMEGEEPIMDQIIITNGFVDERGHYLVNGNSYEIYDPYSNTVTVVVGPPPYTNGVTQPVLAAVSCQPVPLQPVDWYPPGSDWPTQGSAWTPSYPRTPTSQGEAVVGPGQNAENHPDFHGPSDPQIPNLYQQPAYVVPGYLYSESPVYNGDLVHCSPRHQMTETLCSNENKVKVTEDTSTATPSPPQKESKGEKTEGDSATPQPEGVKSQNGSHGASPTTMAQTNEEATSVGNVHQPVPSHGPPIDSANGESSQQELAPQDAQSSHMEERRVEKQSHSTQTTSAELEERIVAYARPQAPYKESHSTQTLPEANLMSNNRLSGNENGKSPGEERGGIRSEEVSGRKEADWKNGHGISSHHVTHQHPQQQQQQQPGNHQGKHNGKDLNQNSSPKKYGEESPRKIYQKRTNFSEERKLKMENGEKSEGSPLKISYAKKAMAGLEATNERNSKVVNGVSSPTVTNNKISNGFKNAQNNLVNGNGPTHPPTTNGINRINHAKQISTPTDRYTPYDDKRTPHNGNLKNGFIKPRYGKNYSGNKQASSPVQSHPPPAQLSKDFRFKDKKMHLKTFEPSARKSPEAKEKVDDAPIIESASPSEKSSTVSELSSPTELSSGQNTPPEKLIVRKMEQKIANEINKSFQQKLKQNLTKKNDGATKTTAPDKDKEARSEGEEDKDEVSEETVPTRPKGKTDLKRRNNPSNSARLKGETPDKTKETTKTTAKKKKKKLLDPPKEKPTETNASSDENSFLPNLILQEPQHLIFSSWEAMKGEEAEMISKMDSILPEDGEILKTLGLNEDKMNLSKLRLHSDLLMMLPAFGWTRPKFKIEDMFTSTKQLQSDLFTRTNITSMKSTKPEEFFASVVDSPAADKPEKPKKDSKSPKNNKDHHQTKADDAPAKDQKSKKNSKTTPKPPKTPKPKPKEDPNQDKPENQLKDKNLGIVQAVNTWLQEQGDSPKLLSLDSIHLPANHATSQTDLKNAICNPMRALSPNPDPQVSLTPEEIPPDNQRMRVANVISDGFVHIDKDFSPRRTLLGRSRKPRSSSLDGKLPDHRIKRHLKFLTDSASFCQDLISDVRNGLPAKGEYATEELCDPRQSVPKYYTLSPRQKGRVPGGRPQGDHDSDDSENEAFDALEYAFLTRGGHGNGLPPPQVVDPDADSSKDTSNGAHKDACKLQ